MIKNILIMVMALGLVGTVQAQRFPGGPPPNYQEKEAKIKAHKISFLTEQLNLTPEEAQVFWPVFNEYAEKEASYKREQKALKRTMANMDAMTDDEVKEALQKHINIQMKEVELRQAYHLRFLEVLGPKKTAKLYKAELEFKRVLLRQLRATSPGTH